MTKKRVSIVVIFIGFIILLNWLSEVRDIRNQEMKIISACSDTISIKNQAQAVDFKELEKNPNSFSGKIVKFIGQVVEIQQNGDRGIIRLSVTKESFGWSFSDIVWVDYQNGTNALKDDIVTVYGLLTGTKIYTSQANYKISLPSITACVIENSSSKVQAQTNTRQGESQESIDKSYENLRTLFEQGKITGKAFVDGMDEIMKREQTLNTDNLLHVKMSDAGMDESQASLDYGYANIRTLYSKGEMTDETFVDHTSQIMRQEQRLNLNILLSQGKITDKEYADGMAEIMKKQQGTPTEAVKTQTSQQIVQPSPTPTQNFVSPTNTLLDVKTQVLKDVYLTVDKPKDFISDTEGMYSQPKIGNKYISVYVSFENKSQNPLRYNPNDFKVVDPLGGSYDTGFILTSKSPELSYGTLNPSNLVSGYILFEVPTTVLTTQFSVHYESSGYPSVTVDFK
ncbi:MAG: DUF4352 domain-containing protein [Candidatus Pacebacteria bacterium]|nr:DUF4352 domain-containing protein [Candidatus Paceibacterota bacterium]